MQRRQLTKGRRRLIRWLALGLALAAVSASAAQAANRPDDRAGPLGVGTQAVTAASAADTQAVRPDDRAGPLGVGTQQVTTDESDVISRYLANHPAAVRPDDRVGPLGVGTQQVTAPATETQALRPDDRAGLLGAGTEQVTTDESDVISRYLVNHPAAVRPDDRGGIRGVGNGTAGITPASARGESSWGTVELGLGSALGALAVALGLSALVRRRRSAAAVLQS